MARTAKPPALTAREAQYILEKLIDERTVSAGDVRRHLAGMWREMNFLEKRLSELRGIVGAVHPVGRTKEVVRRVVKRVRRKATSPEVAASRKLQGQYIAAIRQVPKSERKRFAQIAKKDGREAAIAVIKKRVGKR
jgi:hypothetical protein